MRWELVNLHAIESLEYSSRGTATKWQQFLYYYSNIIRVLPMVNWDGLHVKEEHWFMPLGFERPGDSGNDKTCEDVWVLSAPSKWRRKHITRSYQGTINSKKWCESQWSVTSIFKETLIFSSQKAHCAENQTMDLIGKLAVTNKSRIYNPLTNSSAKAIALIEKKETKKLE